MIDFDRTKWSEFKELFKQSYGTYPSVLSALFLVGLDQFTNEPEISTKEQKQEVIHVGLCTLLSKENLYEFTHFDEEGWPHFTLTEGALSLDIEKQEHYLKNLLINYFL